jgi:3-hydroxybutyryl-CoA dehydrogenase
MINTEQMGPSRYQMVAVLGAGTMGRGIALVAAMSGYRVTLFDTDASQLLNAKATAVRYLENEAAKGRIDSERQDEILKSIKLSEDLNDIKDCSLVIEAIAEDQGAKSELYKKVEEVVSQSAIIATNTSSISVTRLGRSLQKPERFLGLHFFNPAPKMKLVEVVRSLLTSNKVLEDAINFVLSCSKTPVVAPSSPGFIVNRLARPIYLESLLALELGISKIEVLDELAKESALFPMGPFALMDLIGLDVNLAVTKSVFEQTYFDERYRPSLLQEEMVNACLFGRKSGSGFYGYGGDEPQNAVPLEAIEPTKKWSVQRSQSSLLDPLIERVLTSNDTVKVQQNPPRTSKTSFGIFFNETLVSVCDGRSAAEISMETNVPGVVVVDLAFDYGTSRSLGVSTSPGLDRQTLGEIAYLLQASGVRLHLLKDLPGLYITRLVVSLVNEFSEFVLHRGSDPETASTAYKLGLNQSVSALEWLDAVGPKYFIEVSERLYLRYGNSRYRPSQHLRALSLRESSVRSSVGPTDRSVTGEIS